jgi:hypothetical protein
MATTTKAAVEWEKARWWKAPLARMQKANDLFDVKNTIDPTS